MYGSIVARKIKMEDESQLHYDESLAEQGKPFDYTVQSWQEDWFDPAIRPSS